MARIKCSGAECIKILCNKFGFAVSRHRGSHVSLVKFEGTRKISTVVPLHTEIKIRTLRSALKLGEVSEEEFLKFL